MLKTHFNNNSKDKKRGAEINQFYFQKRTIKRSNSDPCSTDSRSKQNQFSKEVIRKERINIENTFLYKIPHDKLRNFYKYQSYNCSLQNEKTEWDTLMIIPEFNAINIFFFILFLISS